jgi:hypothetical protein
MSKRKLLEVAAPSIPKRTRSRFQTNIIKNGPIPPPAPAAMTTSTRATVTATGEAIVTDTPAPVAKGKDIATSCENNIHVLADTSLTFEATHTLANNMLTFASGLDKLALQLQELARGLKMGTAEVLRLYLPEK